MKGVFLASFGLFSIFLDLPALQDGHRKEYVLHRVLVEVEALYVLL